MKKKTKRRRPDNAYDIRRMKEHDDREAAVVARYPDSVGPKRRNRIAEALHTLARVVDPRFSDPAALEPGPVAGVPWAVVEYLAAAEERNAHALRRVRHNERLHALAMKGARAAVAALTAGQAHRLAIEAGPTDDDPSDDDGIPF